ncbi:MAG: IS1634 family transposase [bacterium]
MKQKIGSYIYVYEVESYWDKKKKQPRQKRVYLGREDTNTGEIKKIRGSFKPKYAKEWGNIYLLSEVAERIGLKKVLKEVYPEIWKELLYIAIFEIVEAKPLYLFQKWAENSLVNTKELSSQRISEIMRKIEREGKERERFYKRWVKEIKDIKSIVFDITSFSSYSNLIEEVEWGYNRDEEHLPQINFGMVMGEPSSLPLFYHIYPGSIKDVSTLKNIFLLGESFGIKEVLFVLDKGFYSKENIKEMQGIRFLMPLPFNTKLSHNLLFLHHKRLDSPLNSFSLEKKVLFHIEEKVEIEGIKLVAHIYMDERRKAEELENFLKKIVEIEEKIKKKVWNKKREIEEYIDETIKGGGKFFHIFL